MFILYPKLLFVRISINTLVKKDQENNEKK